MYARCGIGRANGTISAGICLNRRGKIAMLETLVKY
jgi:hypothetical protein